MRFTFSRQERLSGRKRIEHLYSNGTSFSKGKWRIVWIIVENEDNFPAQVMFSAPKKKFKKAVTRNRLKRLMREAYRKNKHTIYTFLNERQLKIHLSLVFAGNAEITYAETESEINFILNRLKKEILSHPKI